MRKVILDLAVTLDGFIEGPGGEVDWCIMDDDMGFDDFLESIDTVFYGRVSYDMWGNYEPAPSSSDAEKRLWSAVHAKEKFVFSHRPHRHDKVTFIHSDIAGQVEAIKKLPGKDIWLYGGAGLISTFLDLGLIDIFRLAVHPTVLGSGKPLFESVKSRLDLKLAGTRVFRSGVVQLIYARM